jgi:23S rRNA pseudouridine1911/1915/1917 synthase
MRLDLALIRLFPELSRRRARDVIEKGQVTVDGARVREAGHPIGDGARVAWDPHRKALPRARCTLEVLYEDEHVLVVDKPAGLLSVPTSPPPPGEDTALGRVVDYVRHLRPRGGYAERVHRLDRDTSGALAFALSPAARAGLIRTFRAHRIERVYLAVVDGSPHGDRGVVDVALREAWASGRRGVARPGEPSRPARTRWQVRERLPGATLLEVALDTGRQHQIRVHLAHARLPIVGDPVYGPPHGPSRPMARRPLLHAWRLALDHPVTGARIEVECPPPADFTRALAALRSEAVTPRRPRESPGRTSRRTPRQGRGRRS